MNKLKSFENMTIGELRKLTKQFKRLPPPTKNIPKLKIKPKGNILEECGIKCL